MSVSGAHGQLCDISLVNYNTLRKSVPPWYVIGWFPLFCYCKRCWNYNSVLCHFDRAYWSFWQLWPTCLLWTQHHPASVPQCRWMLGECSQRSGFCWSDRWKTVSHLSHCGFVFLFLWVRISISLYKVYSYFLSCAIFVQSFDHFFLLGGNSNKYDAHLYVCLCISTGTHKTQCSLHGRWVKK